MNTLCRLDQIQPDQIALVGQKAFYLGQLLQKGHPVVPGVVIPATVFQTFLAQVDWSDPLFTDIPNSSLRLNIENWQQLQAIAQHLRRAILATPLPTEVKQSLAEITAHWHPAMVIVRPSLGVAGSKRSHLAKATLEPLLRTSALMTSQVCGLEDAALEQAIQHLWADFFGAKNLFYWQRLGISLHQVNLSTLIQPLPAAIAAGTLRLVNDHMEIQATLGLGMAIARGEVIPDTYQVQALAEIITAKKLGFRTIAYRAIAPTSDLQPLQIQILNAAQQENFALEEAQIMDLARLGQQVLAEVSSPVELEWVLHPQNGTPTLEFTQVIPLNAPLPSTVKVPPVKAMSDRESTQALMPEVLSEAVLVASGTAASSGHAIASAWILHIEDDLPSELPIGSVLVSKTLPLEWLPLLKNAAAVVMEQGGLTSHSAIVARGLGIPAVVGALHAMETIQPGDLLWVDGDRGQVYRVPQSFKIHPDSFIHQTLSPSPIHATDLSSQHSETVRPAIATQLMVNLSHLEQLETLMALPIDGIGLIRAELLAPSILGTEHPTTWLQHHTSAELIAGFTKSLLPLAQAISPRPVFYRSLDLRPQEFRPLASTSTSSTPGRVLGGTRSYQADPALFDLELAALAQMQQAGATNLCLLLPFVRTVEEFEFCRDRVKQAGLTRHPTFQLWIMAEVPSVLFLLADYVKAGVQGISLGTNDLTQLLFDLDRNQPQTGAVIDERHPAVKRAIAQLIRQAQENNIPCSICGEAPVRYPELIPDLIRWGITAISVAPEAVETTYDAIVQAERTLSLETTHFSKC